MHIGTVRPGSPPSGRWLSFGLGFWAICPFSDPVDLGGGFTPLLWVALNFRAGFSGCRTQCSTAPCPVRLVPPFGEMPLLDHRLSHRRLDKIPDPRRLGIRRTQMFGEKCNPGVIAVIPVTRPVYGSELHEGELLSPVK